MPVDKNTFFEIFTLSICSSLNIEVAMCNTLRKLSPYFDADEMHLYMFDYDNKIFKIIAKATKENGVFLNQVHPLSKEGLEAIWKMNHSKTEIIKRIEEDAILRTLFNEERAGSLSGLLVPLNMEGHVLGAATFYHEGMSYYTEEHAQLMEMIRQPLCIASANAQEHIKLLQLNNKLDEENIKLKSQFHTYSENEIIGTRGGLREVFEMVQLVAPMNCPVLVLGETGTGKEVIANTIYKYSSRNEGPFIKVNCGAIPESLIDSELFGHEKGAFTGAVSQKIGWFERANFGTIFLDEIGELPLEAQVRLLRVIQEHEIERVGGKKSIPLDIRIICATNRNLSEMVKNGTFREDLFFRINVFPIYMPPLRQRTEDIPLLVHRMADRKAQEMGLKHVPEVTQKDMEHLQSYSWPGNVRELQNIVERALILRKGNTLEFNHLLPEVYKISAETFQKNNEQKERLDYAGSLDASMAQIIIDALKKTKGRISGPKGAAELLGINASTLRSRMKKLGILNIYRI